MKVAREVEMHRPDGRAGYGLNKSSTAQLLILAQFHTIGPLDSRHSRTGLAPIILTWAMERPRPMGRIYESTLRPNEVKGDYSGRAG